MNAAHFHLAVNHFPVVLFFFGSLLLLLSLFLENVFWRKTACVVIFAAAVSSVPAFLSGEGAEHFLEKLGTSEAVIEPHEKTAKLAFGGGLVTGAVAALVWLALKTGNRFLRPLSFVLMACALMSSAAFFYTSFQGGKIVHMEIRDKTAVLPAPNARKIKKHKSDDQI